MSDLPLLSCPVCFRDWPEDCEQAISIEMYGECCVCKFTPRGEGINNGTTEQLHSISEEQRRRAAI